MRSEGAAPRPVAPLCGALSLVLGALLGKGKAGAGVAPRSPGRGNRKAGVSWGPWRGRWSHQERLWRARGGPFPSGAPRTGFWGRSGLSAIPGFGSLPGRGGRG